MYHTRVYLPRLKDVLNEISIQFQSGRCIKISINHNSDLDAMRDVLQAKALLRVLLPSWIPFPLVLPYRVWLNVKYSSFDGTLYFCSTYVRLGDVS
jgi:hypothetical protein